MRLIPNPPPARNLKSLKPEQLTPSLAHGVRRAMTGFRRGPPVPFFLSHEIIGSMACLPAARLSRKSPTADRRAISTLTHRGWQVTFVMPHFEIPVAHRWESSPHFSNERYWLKLRLTLQSKQYMNRSLAFSASKSSWSVE